MKVFWTETAVENLSAIYTYISQNSPQYATRIIDRITKVPSNLRISLYLVELYQSLKPSKFGKLLKVHIELSITSNSNRLMYLLLYMGHRKLHQV